MQGHAVSLYHVLYHARLKHKIKFLNNLIFVDFGCGPITAALSMAFYNLKHHVSGGKTGLRFNYIGLDQSEAMLTFGEEVQKAAGGLFNDQSTFDYLGAEDASKELIPLIEKYRRSSGSTICLNFSYYFASQTIDVGELVKLVKWILTDFADEKICVVFQNADNPYKNGSWEQFKEYTTDVLFSCYGDKSEIVSYYNVTGRRNDAQPIGIKLLHAVLVNQTLKEHLES